MGKSFAILAVALMFAFAAPVYADTNVGVEAQVSSYFADIPVMSAIANCESGFREFTSSGAVLYGGTNNEMVGVFQIDGSLFFSKAMALGFNIDTVAGNLGYARYLYGSEGTSPWISSFPCWGPVSAAAVSATATSTAIVASMPVPGGASSSVPVLTMDVSLGMINPQVLTLQQLLNQTGFTLATSGPGSPGDETTKFGALTLAALKQFQCARGIACSGDEYTTGYGFANTATRSALVALAAGPAAPAQATTTASPVVVATSALPTSTPVVAPTSSVLATDNLAEIAQLKSQITALETIVAQLEAEIAAKI